MNDKPSQKTCHWYPVCPMKRYTDQGILDPVWVKTYCLVSNPRCIRYQMEEKGQYHPDNMLPDGNIDPFLPG